MNFVAIPAEEIVELVDFKNLPIGQWFRMDLKGRMLRSTWKKVSSIHGRDGATVLEQGYCEKVWWIKNYIDPDTIPIIGTA